MREPVSRLSIHLIRPPTAAGLSEARIGYMTYQVLARKWRPQDFTGLIGQEPIITALRNSLKENRIAQAYLFSGIRGVGKTTAARILSKALNCERGPTEDHPAEDPCNQCPPCTEITAGRDLDVLEVDAATYSKVEQVRELTESLRYGPTRDRFKVVVLDEVHRLSRQAFDALLKIVEEPPPHLVFIFATTEKDAVPATILSRCQEFQFRRVVSPVMATYLRQISDSERIQVSDSALRLVARAGEGSVRDAVALLDQLATFGNGHIDDRDASNLLGGLDTDIFRRLLSAILDGKPLLITEIAHEIESNGWDPHNVYSQFLIYTKDALKLAMGGKPETIDLPIEEAQALTSLVRPFAYESILRLSQHLLASESTIRGSEFASLALQLAWLRAAELPKLTLIESLLSGREAMSHRLADTGSSGTVASTVKTPEKPSKTTVSDRGTSDRGTSAPQATTQHDQSPGATSRGVSRFRNLLAERRQPLAALVESAELEFVEGQLHIQPSPGDPLLAAALQRENNTMLLDELLEQVWGPGSRWTLRESEQPQPSARDEQDRTVDAAPSEATKDPTVKAVLDIFGGNIQSVQ